MKFQSGVLIGSKFFDDDAPHERNGAETEETETTKSHIVIMMSDKRTCQLLILPCWRHSFSPHALARTNCYHHHHGANVKTTVPEPKSKMEEDSSKQTSFDSLQGLLNYSVVHSSGIFNSRNGSLRLLDTAGNGILFDAATESFSIPPWIIAYPRTSKKLE